MTRKLFVLNGPNLNMLGLREPELYGTATLEDVRVHCDRVAEELGFELFFAQSNAEHEIVEWVHDAFREKATVVINPAGFSFRSVPLLDALHMLVRRSSRSTSRTSMPAMPSTSTRSSRRSLASSSPGRARTGTSWRFAPPTRLTAEPRRTSTERPLA